MIVTGSVNAPSFCHIYLHLGFPHSLGEQTESNVAFYCATIAYHVGLNAFIRGYQTQPMIKKNNHTNLAESWN